MHAPAPGRSSAAAPSGGRASAPRASPANAPDGRLGDLDTNALKSWEALFGYTSDAGIRHGMTEGQPAMELADALHLVVTCSAIVSYMTRAQPRPADPSTGP